MFKPWITVPAEDIHVQLPMSQHEGEVKIMFRDAVAIDKTIEQLENLKAFVDSGITEKIDTNSVKPIDGNKLIRILEHMERHMIEFEATQLAELCKSLIKLIAKTPILEVKDVV